MKKIYRVLIGLAAVSLLLTMCGVQTQNPRYRSGIVTSTVTATSTPQIPTSEPLKITVKIPERYTPPDIVLVIDNSYSMVEANDHLGGACDTSGMRYRIADFLVRIFSDLNDKKILFPDSTNNPSRIFLVIMDRKEHNEDKHPGKFQVLIGNLNKSSISENENLGDQSVQKIFSELHDRINKNKDPETSSGSEFHGLPEIQHEIKLLDLKPNSIVVFITDGDFRNDRTQNLDKNKWDGDENRAGQHNYVASTINAINFLGTLENAGTQGEKQGFKMHFLLICSHRIQDSNIDGINDNEMLKIWDERIEKNLVNTSVYRFDKAENITTIDNPYTPDIIEDGADKLKAFLENILLETKFRFEISDASKPAWAKSVRKESILTGDKEGIVKDLPAALVFFTAGVIPFDEKVKPSIKFDGKTWSDQHDPLPQIPNESNCLPHVLSFNTNTHSDFTFAWWQAISLDSLMHQAPIESVNHSDVIIPLEFWDDANNQTIPTIVWPNWKSCLVITPKSLIVSESSPSLRVAGWEFKSTSGNLPIEFNWKGSDAFPIINLNLSYVDYAIPKLVPAENDEYGWAEGELSFININYGRFHPSQDDDDKRYKVHFESNNSNCSLSQADYANITTYGTSVSHTSMGYEISFDPHKSGHFYSYLGCDTMVLSWLWRNWPPHDEQNLIPKNLRCDLTWNPNNTLKNAKCQEMP